MRAQRQAWCLRSWRTGRETAVGQDLSSATPRGDTEPCEVDSAPRDGPARFPPNAHSLCWGGLGAEAQSLSTPPPSKPAPQASEAQVRSSRLLHYLLPAPASIRVHAHTCTHTHAITHFPPSDIPNADNAPPLGIPGFQQHCVVRECVPQAVSRKGGSGPAWLLAPLPGGGNLVCSEGHSSV